MNYELEVYKALLNPMLIGAILIGIGATVLAYEGIHTFIEWMDRKEMEQDAAEEK